MINLIYTQTYSYIWYNVCWLKGLNLYMLKSTKISTEIETDEQINITIPDEHTGKRIDTVLALMIPELSRTRLTNWLKSGNILVDGKILRPKDKILGGEIVLIDPLTNEEELAYLPEEIPLDIIYEDEHILVINKPAGLVVHPGSGNWSGTLLNGLLFCYPELKNIPRAGIVHRLDKDTTGLMVVARTLGAQTQLVRQLQDRQVTRIYRAIVEGHPHQEGVVNKSIGRDPNNRVKMATIAIGGKEAITKFRVLQNFDKFSYIECKLETGRTHQIRVHMKSIGHPLVGDPIYGNHKVNYAENVVEAILSLNRQALHATKLSFIHPITEELMNFKIALPQDFKYLLQQLTQTKLNNTNEFDDDNDDDDNWEVIYVRE